jgi:glyoxylase-like metal-dependent hydrolase (beta-lactamase superfamily II)
MEQRLAAFRVERQPRSMLRLHSLEGNRQRLDGGAMFGNCPRAVWERWTPPDEQGRIDLACRALLVEILPATTSATRPRRILLETGIGAFFEPKMRARFGVVEPQHILLESLARRGLTDADIDVVILSHLHFDHAGGLLAAFEDGAAPRLLFPNAAFVVGAEAWARAESPHPRDRASFIPALGPLLRASGRLRILDLPAGSLLPQPPPRELGLDLGPHFLFSETSGHTPGMLHTTIRGDRGSVFFAADLVPGLPWVHLPVTMGYDRAPERLIDEKASIFKSLRLDTDWLFYPHDARFAASRLRRNDDGRYLPVTPMEHLEDFVI